MRVEINFSGDSSEAVISSEEVTRAVRKLFVQAEETAQAVQEIKISSAQAAESSVAAKRMANDIQQIGQEARKSRREIEALKLSGSTGRSGVGLGPLGSGFGRVGLLGAAVGLGTATSGPLAGGAAALGIGALGVSGGALGAVGVLVASFHGLGKAVAGDRQEFEKLSPATQTFVQDVRSLIPWLHQLQEISRAGLLPGVEKGLHAALNPQTAGAIQQMLRGISGELGKLAEEAGHGIGGPQFQQFLNDAGTHGVTQIDNLGHAFGHVASSLLTLMHAGQPLADWLTRVADDGARFVDEWLKAADASGALGDKLEGARHELELVGHLVGALVEAVGALATDLTPLGNEIIVTLTNALHGLADWLHRNHDEVVAFTTGALAALISSVQTAWPIVENLAKALKAIVDAVGGWQAAFEIVIAGAVVVGINNIATAVYGLRTALLVANPELAVLLAAAAALAIWVHSGGTTKFSQNVPGSTSDKVTYENGQWWQQTKNAGRGHSGTRKAIDITQAAALLGTTPEALLNKTAAGGGGKYDYPLATHGSLIGTPYQGTHGKAFNQAGGSDNWESENAVDIAVKVGTPVVAVEDGVIGSAIGSLGSGGRFAGLRLHLMGDSGNEYYYAHLSTIIVKAGQRVKKGQALGMSGSANGVAHLHFASKSGDPRSVINGSAISSGLTPPSLGTTSTPGGVGNPFGNAPPFSDKGAQILPAALRLAMAKAQTTPSTGDDRTTINAAVKWLKANVGGFTGEDQINAYLELASLLGQLKTLGKKAATGIASRASRISASAEAGSLIAALSGVTQTPLFSSEGPQFADAAYAHNRPFATKGPYQTKLTDEEEARFRAWLRKYKVPFDPDDPRSDYDMRGYWKANQGKAYKGGHFPDTFKTPYDTTFSAESKYATANNPFKWDGNNLIDTRTGRLIFGKGGGGIPSILDHLYNPTQSMTPQAGVSAAVKHLTDVRRTLLPEIQAISREIDALAGQPGSAKTLAVLRAQMAQYKKTITSALTDVKDAIARQRTSFQDAWQKLGDDMIAGLEAKRGSYKSPARLLLDQLTATHDTKALNDALDQANVDLATALKGHQADAQQQLDDIKKFVGTAFLTNALDAAQSAILGGDTAQMSAGAILTKLQGILAGGNVVDPDEVKRAQQAVEDAKYAITVAGLEKTASAQEAAYNAEIDAQETMIRNMQDNWEKYFTSLHGDIDKAKQAWVDFFKNIGLTPGGTSPSDNPGGNSAFQGFSSGTWTDYLGIPHDPASGDDPAGHWDNGKWVNPAGSTGGSITKKVGGASLISKLSNLPGFAGGGDFITSGPTPIMVGEGGVPERVRITPAHGGAAGGNESITVIIQTRDEALADFIDVRVEGATSQISRRTGQDADIRRRSGRY